jgi:hypothetical protein
MKDPKILPFGSWFKVYEQAGRNFKKSQQILESRSYRGMQKIFEALEPPAPGADLKLPNDYSKIFADHRAEFFNLITANREDTNVRKLINAAKKILEKDGNIYDKDIVNSNFTPESYLSIWLAGFTSRNKLSDKQDTGDSYRFQKVPKLTFERLVQAGNSQFVREDSYDIALTPGKNNPNVVATKGKVIGRKITNLGDDSYSSYTDVKQYINLFNLLNTISDGTATYDGDSIVDGFLDLETTAYSAGSLNSVYFYVDTLYQGGQVAREESEDENEVGGETELNSQQDIKFKQAALPDGAVILETELPKIEKLASDIALKFKGKTVDTFELFSSASPEYGAIKNAAGWEANYAKYKNAEGKITAMGDPGAGTDDASNNAKLAYERGVSFMKELNAKLNAQGHPGFAKYTIQWQIAASGGPANDGRYVDLFIKKNEVKPLVVKTTDINGKVLKDAKTTSGKSESKMYCYHFSI